MMPLISVIMSIYNEPIEWIRLSTSSILSQTFDDFELILVVDNPNIDNEVRQYLLELDSIDKVSIIYNESNLGLVKSLNIALKNANGKYIARMDADDISSDDRLEKQINYLCNNDLDLIGSNIQDIDTNGLGINRITVFPEQHDSIKIKAKYNSPISHPTWFGKKQLFDSLNGYQDIEACEDYDFLVRAILNGYKLGNIQDVLLKYRINPNGISSSKKAIQKNSLYYVRKNYKDGKTINETDYKNYLKSDKGLCKLNKLESFYKKYKVFKSINAYSSKALYGLYMFIISTEARLLLLNYILEKVFVK